MLDRAARHRVPVQADDGAGGGGVPDRAARGLPRRHQGGRRAGARAAHRVRPDDGGGPHRDRRGRPRRHRHHVGVGPPARTPSTRSTGRSPGRSSSPTAPTRRCSARSTPARPRRCRTGMRVEPVWADEREGSITRPRPLEGRLMAEPMTEITLPERAPRRRAGALRAHAGRARCSRYTPGARQQPLPQGHRPEEDHRRAAPSPAPGSTCRPAAPTRSSASPPPSRSRSSDGGTVTSFCVVNVLVLRRHPGDPVHDGAHPARRLRPPDHAPHPGVPGRPGPHRHAASRRCGCPTTSSAPPWSRSSGSAPPASPTSTSTSPARTAPLWLDSRGVQRRRCGVRDVAIIGFAQTPHVRRAAPT